MASTNASKSPPTDDLEQQNGNSPDAAFVNTSESIGTTDNVSFVSHVLAASMSANGHGDLSALDSHQLSQSNLLPSSIQATPNVGRVEDESLDNHTASTTSSQEQTQEIRSQLYGDKLSISEDFNHRPTLEELGSRKEQTHHGATGPDTTAVPVSLTNTSRTTGAAITDDNLNVQEAADENDNVALVEQQHPHTTPYVSTELESQPTSPGPVLPSKSTLPIDSVVGDQETRPQPHQLAADQDGVRLSEPTSLTFICADRPPEDRTLMGTASGSSSHPTVELAACGSGNGTALLSSTAHLHEAQTVDHQPQSTHADERNGQRPTADSEANHLQTASMPATAAASADSGSEPIQNEQPPIEAIMSKDSESVGERSNLTTSPPPGAGDSTSHHSECGTHQAPPDNDQIEHLLGEQTETSKGDADTAAAHTTDAASEAKEKTDECESSAKSLQLLTDLTPNINGFAESVQISQLEDTEAAPSASANLNLGPKNQPLDGAPIDSVASNQRQSENKQETEKPASAISDPNEHVTKERATGSPDQANPNKNQDEDSLIDGNPEAPTSTGVFTKLLSSSAAIVESVILENITDESVKKSIQAEVDGGSADAESPATSGALEQLLSNTARIAESVALPKQIIEKVADITEVKLDPKDCIPCSKTEEEVSETGTLGETQSAITTLLASTALLTESVALPEALQEPNAIENNLESSDGSVSAQNENVTENNDALMLDTRRGFKESQTDSKPADASDTSGTSFDMFSSLGSKISNAGQSLSAKIEKAGNNIQKKTQELGERFEETASAASAKAQEAVASVEHDISAAKNSTSKNIEDIKEKTQSVKTSISETIKDVKQDVTKGIVTLQSDAEGLLDKAQTAATEEVDHIKSSAKSCIEESTAVARKTAEDIQGIAESVKDTTTESIHEIKQLCEEQTIQVKKDVENVVESAKDSIQDTISDTKKTIDELQIHAARSADKAQEASQSLLQDNKDMIEQSVRNTILAGEQVFTEIKSAASELGEGTLKQADDSTQVVKDKLLVAADTVADKISSAVSIATDVVDSGKAALSGVSAGVQEAAASVVQATNDFVVVAKDTVNEGLSNEIARLGEDIPAAKDKITHAKETSEKVITEIGKDVQETETVLTENVDDSKSVDESVIVERTQTLSDTISADSGKTSTAAEIDSKPAAATTPKENEAETQEDVTSEKTAELEIDTAAKVCELGTVTPEAAKLQSESNLLLHDYTDRPTDDINKNGKTLSEISGKRTHTDEDTCTSSTQSTKVTPDEIEIAEGTGVNKADGHKSSAPIDSPQTTEFHQDLSIVTQDKKKTDNTASVGELDLKADAVSHDASPESQQHDKEAIPEAAELYQNKVIPPLEEKMQTKAIDLETSKLAEPCASQESNVYEEVVTTDTQDTIDNASTADKGLAETLGNDEIINKNAEATQKDAVGTSALVTPHATEADTTGTVESKPSLEMGITENGHEPHKRADIETAATDDEEKDQTQKLQGNTSEAIENSDHNATIDDDTKQLDGEKLDSPSKESDNHLGKSVVTAAKEPGWTECVEQTVEASEDLAKGGEAHHEDEQAFKSSTKVDAGDPAAAVDLTTEADIKSDTPASNAATETELGEKDISDTPVGPLEEAGETSLKDRNAPAVLSGDQAAQEKPTEQPELVVDKQHASEEEPEPGGNLKVSDRIHYESNSLSDASIVSNVDIEDHAKLGGAEKEDMQDSISRRASAAGDDGKDTSTDVEKTALESSPVLPGKSVDSSVSDEKVDSVPEVSKPPCEAVTDVAQEDGTPNTDAAIKHPSKDANDAQTTDINNESAELLESIKNNLYKGPEDFSSKDTKSPITEEKDDDDYDPLSSKCVSSQEPVIIPCSFPCLTQKEVHLQKDSKPSESSGGPHAHLEPCTATLSSGAAEEGTLAKRSSELSSLTRPLQTSPNQSMTTSIYQPSSLQEQKADAIPDEEEPLTESVVAAIPYSTDESDIRSPQSQETRQQVPLPEKASGIEDETPVEPIADGVDQHTKHDLETVDQEDFKEAEKADNEAQEKETPVTGTQVSEIEEPNKTAKSEKTRRQSSTSVSDITTNEKTSVVIEEETKILRVAFDATDLNDEDTCPVLNADSNSAVNGNDGKPNVDNSEDVLVEGSEGRLKEPYENGDLTALIDTTNVPEQDGKKIPELSHDGNSHESICDEMPSLSSPPTHTLIKADETVGEAMLVTTEHVEEPVHADDRKIPTPSRDEDIEVASGDQITVAAGNTEVEKKQGAIEDSEVTAANEKDGRVDESWNDVGDLDKTEEECQKIEEPKNVNEIEQEETAAVTIEDRENSGDRDDRAQLTENVSSGQDDNALDRPVDGVGDDVEEPKKAVTIENGEQKNFDGERESTDERVLNGNEITISTEEMNEVPDDEVPVSDEGHEAKRDQDAEVVEDAITAESAVEALAEKEDESEKKDAEHDRSEEKSDKKELAAIETLAGLSPRSVKRRPRSPEKKVKKVTKTEDGVTRTIPTAMAAKKSADNKRPASPKKSPAKKISSDDQKAIKSSTKPVSPKKVMKKRATSSSTEKKDSEVEKAFKDMTTSEKTTLKKTSSPFSSIKPRIDSHLKDGGKGGSVRRELVLKLESSKSAGESRSEANTPADRPPSPAKKKMRSKEAPEIGAAAKRRPPLSKRAKSAAPSAYRRLMQQASCDVVSSLSMKTRMKKSPSADLDAVKKSKAAKGSTGKTGVAACGPVVGDDALDADGSGAAPAISKSTSCSSDLAAKANGSVVGLPPPEGSIVTTTTTTSSVTAAAAVGGPLGSATITTITTTITKRTKSPSKQIVRPPWTNYFS